MERNETGLNVSDRMPAMDSGAVRSGGAKTHCAHSGHPVRDAGNATEKGKARAHQHTL